MTIQVYKCIVFLGILTSLSKRVVLQTTDLTIDDSNSPTGPIVVRAVIAKLDHAFSNRTLFPNGSELWKPTHSTFMRILAYVESSDGTIPITSSSSQMQDSTNGIWRAKLAHVNSAINNCFNRPAVGSVCEHIGPQIKNNLNITFPGLNLDLLGQPDVQQMSPMNSALSARLVLLYSGLQLRTSNRCGSDKFPTARTPLSEMATFWLICYRQITAYHNTYNTLYEMFINKSQKLPNDCSIESDLAFVLDSSGSIGYSNWFKVVNITATTASAGNERVALITFSNSAMTHINFTTNQNNLVELVKSVRYTGGGTNTADGLCHLLDQEWRENVLQIAIVMTDGRSNQISSRCGNTTTAIQRVNEMSSLIILVVAVGDNVYYPELEEIATSNEGIYSLQDELNVANIIDQQAYHMCYIASSPMIVGSSTQSNIGKQTLRFTYEFPEGGLTVRICIADGEVSLYGSFTISNPNKALHDFALDAFILGTVCQDVFVQQSVSTRKKRQTPAVSSPNVVHVSIEGRAESNSFTLETAIGDTAEYTVTCDDNPCGDSSYCIMQNLGYSCECVPGYKFGPSLFNCIDVNECQLFPPVCGQFATCHNYIGGYNCSCKAGYVGDGTKCIIDQNTELQFIVTVACGVGGGLVAMVVVLAALIAICKAITAKKDSKYHQRDDRRRPADPNLNFSSGAEPRLDMKPNECYQTFRTSNSTRGTTVNPPPQYEEVMPVSA